MQKTNRNTTAILAVLALILFSVPGYAQNGWGGFGNGPGEFIDENGDGINDLAPDHDGDGIPNSLDEDWVRPQDGSGAGNGPGAGGAGNDDSGNGNGNGPGGGNGNGGVGPGDGTGNGPGTGDCIAEPETAPRIVNSKRVD